MQMSTAQGHILGRQGFKLIADTSTHTAGSGSHADIEAFGLITIVADTVFATGTTSLLGDNPSTSATYTAGSVVRGVFSAIKLTSGTIHAQRIEKVNSYFD